jgi:outer membrane protein assembly factor BamE (lipoprotein component of BamABCDE complex)
MNAGHRIRTLLLACILLLSACATVGNESLATRDADWPPLTMTQAELIKELGLPTVSTTTVQDGKTVSMLTWSYARAESNPALFIPIVGLFVAASGKGMDVQSRGLTVMFDTDGAMKSRTWIRTQTGQRSTDTASPPRQERSGP